MRIQWNAEIQITLKSKRLLIWLSDVQISGVQISDIRAVRTTSNVRILALEHKNANNAEIRTFKHAWSTNRMSEI